MLVKHFDFFTLKKNYGTCTNKKKRYKGDFKCEINYSCTFLIRQHPKYPTFFRFALRYHIKLEKKKQYFIKSTHRKLSSDNKYVRCVEHHRNI